MSQENTQQGWDCITEVFENIYLGQTNPLHFGTVISWTLGGPDPLDGISIYDGGDYYHFVTYGLSELYEKESENLEYSGYGYELTVKLKKEGTCEDDLKGMAGILQSIARITFENGEIFAPNEYIYTGQTTGMDSNGQSKITGFMTKLDDMAGSIHTPNGKVEFVQLVGMTDKEIREVIEKRNTTPEMLKLLGHDLTDYTRNDII